MRRKVDLPAPERPMMPTKAGRSMVKLMLSTAAFWPNIRVTLSASISIWAPVFALRGCYRLGATEMLRKPETFVTATGWGCPGRSRA